MTMFNAANANPQTIVSQVQAALVQIRSAMLTAQALYGWSSGTAMGDLTAAPPNGPGLPPADAQAVLSACADAYGLSLLYTTGTDPRNPGAGYVYGASQKIVIGPRMN
jgi:hypothetical protein